MSGAGDVTIIGQGRFARFVRRDDWEYLERERLDGIVALVAVTDGGSLVLVEQYRPPVRRRVVELPAGLAGDTAAFRGEPLQAAARRELIEETGYDADRIERLAEGTPSAGIVTEVVTFFRARGLTRVAPGGGHGDEQIEVHEVPLAGVTAWLAERTAAGALVDIKVWAGLHFLAAERPA